MSQRLLLVEDDKYLNKLLTDRLVLEGFDVFSALDGDTAWQELQSAQSTDAPYEIVVSDMLLPRMMGAELFSKIRERKDFERLKIVAMSGIYKDDVQVQELKKLHGLQSYWLKPFEIKDLVSELAGKIAEAHSPQNGDLSQISTEKLFLNAYEEGFTGELILKRIGAERKIFFSHGFPVGASSSNLSESFGQSLVDFGFISQDIHEKASRGMVAKHLQLGQMLIEMGALTEHQIFDGLRRHTYRLMLHTFAWRSGQFEFKKMNELPKYILQLEFNPLLMMLRAQRSLLPSDVIQSLIQTKSDQYCKRADRSVQLLGLFNLDEKSLEFLRTLPGDRPLGDILSSVPPENHELVFRALYVLESLELIEWKSEPQGMPRLDMPSADFSAHFTKGNTQSQELLGRLQSEYMNIINKDYFEIFNLSDSASIDTIDKAYREIRYQYHPDRFGDNIDGQAKRILDDILKRLDKAYSILSNPSELSEYRAQVKKLKSDSAAESKKFLDAQDAYREGLRHLNAQNFDDAQAQFLLAHEHWPRSPEYQLYAHYANFRLGRKSQDQIKMNQAFQKLQEPSSFHPESDIGFVLLGHMFQALNRPKEAKQAYQSALRINESNEEAANALHRLVGQELDHEKLSRTVKRSASAFRKSIFYVIPLILSVASFVIYSKLRPQDAGVKVLNPADVQGILPAKALRQKDETLKITVGADWIQNVPASVFEAKCYQLLTNLKPNGITSIYVSEAQEDGKNGGGLKAYCKEGFFQRF